MKMRPANMKAQLSTRTGFTVMEVILAVSAFMLLATVLLSILRIIDRTRVAGQTLSTRTSVSALLEQRLRQDFDRMSRDGFLLVRNQLTAQPVSLSEGVANRRRRIDEIMFFSSAPATTLRASLDARRTAQGPQAAIYIGHGLPRGTEAAALDDENTTAPTFGTVGPSRFAKDWVLARLPLTLSAALNPATTVTRGGLQPSNARELDSPIQVALQPAAPSIFRSINLSARGNPRVLEGLRGFDVPQIASGTVDVVSTDLSAITQQLLAETVRSIYAQAMAPVWPPLTAASVPTDPLNPPLVQAERDVMELMADALPADSAAGRRMRVERESPPIAINRPSDARVDQSQRDDATMVTTTAMLPGVSEFIVEWSYGATYGTGGPAELAGQTIWHGLPRAGDPDGLGVTQFTGSYPRATYGDAGTLVADARLAGAVNKRVLDDQAAGATSVQGLVAGGPALVTARSDRRICILYPRLGLLPGLHELSQQRVHGDTAAALGLVDSYFGPIDLRYRPLASRVVGSDLYPTLSGVDRQNDGRLRSRDADKSLLVRDVNGNGRYDPLDGDTLAVPDTLATPWPTQFRITVRYAGAGVPTGSEQTYVFTFKAPGNFPSYVY